MKTWKKEPYVSFAKASKEERLCTLSSEAHCTVTSEELYPWKQGIFLIQVISMLHRISCLPGSVRKSYLLNICELPLRIFWDTLVFTLWPSHPFFLSWVWCILLKHFPVHISLKCMLHCSMFYSLCTTFCLLPLHWSLLLLAVMIVWVITPKCGSRRIKLGARVLLCISGYAASWWADFNVII